MERIGIIITGTVFSLLWASAFVVGKIALRTTDPMSLLCARFLLAGSILITWTRIRRGTFFSTTALGDGIVLGLFNNALYLGLSLLGLRTISPEATILIVSLAPFVTTGLSLCLGSPSSFRHFAGMGIGFLGVCVVMSLRLHGGEDIGGMILVTLGMLSFSIGTIWYQRRSTHHDAIALNGLQNLSAGLMLLPFANNLGGLVANLGNPVFASSLLHLVIGVSIIDFLIWLALLRRIEVGVAASFHLLNPLFGIFLSWLLIGSVVQTTDILGVLLVLIGLGLILSVTISKPKIHTQKRLSSSN